MPQRAFKSNRLKFLYLLIGIIGLVLVGIEIYLNSKNTSLCKNEGCIILHRFDKYNTLNYFGLAIFFYLFFVSLLDIFNFRLSFFLKLRTYLVSLSIIVEGYLIGFQTWFLNTYCQYCLLVAFCLFFAFLLDYFYPEKEMVSFSTKKERTSIYRISIFGFISLFLITYLVNLSLKPLNFNSPVIVYKKDCINCEEVISYAKEKNIKIELYKIKDILPLIKIINVNSVPILLSKENERIIMISGKDEIKKWFDEKYGIKNDSEKFEEKKTKKKESLIYLKESDKIANETEEGVCTIEKPCQ